MGTNINITTIDSVPEDAITEIMLRLQTPADLVHAALALKSWHRIISDQHFLAKYRKRHPSSPFLGIYVPQEFGGLPSFLMADSIRSASDGEGDLKRAGAKAFSLGGLESSSEWRLLDSYNGRLLLARGDEAIEVYSPLSRERISVCLPQGDVLPESFSACLLQGHGDDVASFRVVSVQHHRDRRDRMVRAIVYDSRTMIWTDHPWMTLNNIEGTERGEVKVMHAGGLIFCKYIGNSLLLLDTSNMEFSPLPLPDDNNPKNYVIGELKDGVCCLVSANCVGLLNNIHLRVWKLKNLKWKLKKEMRLKEVLGNYPHYSHYNVRAVTNGIALLCSSKRHLHFVIDLKTFSVKEKFEFKDMAAYPFQMPWPPTFSVAVGSGEQSTPSTGIHPDVSVNLVVEQMVPIPSNQCGNIVADGPICGVIQKNDTLTYAECKLNTQDDLIPCNDDVIPVGCDSHDSDKIKAVDSDGQSVECKLNTDDHLIPWNVDVIVLGCDSQLKNPEKRKYTWDPIEVFKTKMYSVLGAWEDGDIEC